MGAELNAATSREHTMVYSRVPDRHLDEALEVMTDMVFAPAFAELDQEREVVLEEIAMYEDTPHELVHDLFSEAVFGSHALGRPGDRHRGSDLVRHSPRNRRLPPLHVHGREHRRRGRGERPARQVRVAARALRAQERGRAGWPARAPAAHAGAAAERALRAQGHRAVPPVPRRARYLALRPPTLCRVAARLDPRRVRVVAPLPGDPREAGDGVLGLHVRVAVHGHGTDRDLRRHARGESRDVRRDLHRADRRARSRPLQEGRGRACEGEPQGPDHALDGVDVKPHEPAR